MTKTKKTLLVLVIVLAVALWWALHSIGTLVATAIRTYGPKITGVEVRLDDVTLSPFSGTATLRGLVVGNPEGYQTDHALALGRFSASLRLRSLSEDVIVVKRIVIANADVTYELGLKGSNLGVIQKNVERNTKGGGASAKEGKAPENGGKKLVIDDLIIKDATVHVSAKGLKGNAVPVPLPDIHLQGIGRKSNGASPAEAVGQVLGALTKSVSAAVAKVDVGGAAESIKKGAKSAGEALKGLMKKGK